MTMKHTESVLGRYFRSKAAILEVSGTKGMWTAKVMYPELGGISGSRDQIVASAFGKTRKESLRNMAVSVLIWTGKESLEELELEMDSLGIGLEGRKWVTGRI